jgi:hypothetical protein
VVAGIGAPILIGNAFAFPAVVVGIGNVPPPSDVGQIRGEWPQSDGGGWGSSAAAEWPQTEAADWESTAADEWPQTNDEEWELVP